ncbi:sodium/proline symporter PutP [Sphingomonas sp. HDW15A]|uniref:sodium/proline symporter PutP n=1 Tax=Sphingomonas sp. HDW15A TaxID=2714942 RepID=UPI001408CBF5|nr:sodium/proline symporter PutP [Sphingomonas sp. HDW15A]QIK95240.1 sodium/proline symporter PutP [Sphingomonas sp. HDW15A]
METGTLIALAIYFVAMLGIGFYAWRKSTQDVDGYLLGGRDLGPAVTALSAGASDMSGWLMLGLPGAIFLSGLGQAWIGIGLIIGAYLNYRLVAPRLRTYTELANDAITVPDYFEERFRDKSHALRLVSALVIIVFFALYTSAGMVAGGKFAVSALGMDYLTGILLMGGIVVVYTVMGGFLAVSLTDFVQGCIMFLALVLVPLVAWIELGDGLAPALAAAEASRGLSLTQFIGGDVTLLAIVSAAAWGLGYFGQPHIIVRFMAIRNVRDMPTARRINIGWMSISLLGAVLTGLIGAAWFAARGGAPADEETVFLLLSKILFHPFIAGFVLAAVLAAIMSTISSQLLVTSSSLTEDIYRTFLNREAGEKQLVTIGRVMVVLVSIVAGVLALDPESTVLGIVGNAWAGFGAAFGPAILFSLRWKRTTRQGVLAGMIVGALVVVAWILLGWSATLYEIVPGFIASSLAIWLVSTATPAPTAEIQSQFDEAAVAAKGA